IPSGVCAAAASSPCCTCSCCCCCSVTPSCSSFTFAARSRQYCLSNSKTLHIIASFRGGDSKCMRCCKIKTTSNPCCSRSCSSSSTFCCTSTSGGRCSKQQPPNASSYRCSKFSRDKSAANSDSSTRDTHTDSAASAACTPQAAA